jgi:hypothetical protein
MFGFNFINRQLKILIFPEFLGYKALAFCPNYAKEIVSLISSQKWLFHNFNLEDESNLYDISNYLLAKKIYNRKYTIVLDTNIYDFLLKIVRNPDKEKHRGAAALLAFCQLSEIEINPFFAVHEKLESDSIDNILDDLTLFNKINNSETTALANYALSKSNHINLNHNMDLARNSIKQLMLRSQY